MGAQGVRRGRGWRAGGCGRGRGPRYVRLTAVGNGRRRAGDRSGVDGQGSTTGHPWHPEAIGGPLPTSRCPRWPNVSWKRPAVCPHPLDRHRPRPAPLPRSLLGLRAREESGEERARERVARARGVPGSRRYGRDLGEHRARAGHQRTVRPLFGDHQRDMVAQLGRRVRRVGQPRQQTRLVTAGQQDVDPLHQLQETVDTEFHEEPCRRRIQAHRHTTRACGGQGHLHQRAARLREQQIARQMQPGHPVEQRVRPVVRIEPQGRAAVREKRPLGRGARVDETDHRPGRRLRVDDETGPYPAGHQLPLVPHGRVRPHPPEQPYLDTTPTGRPAGHVGPRPARQRPDRRSRVGARREWPPVPGHDVGDDVTDDQQRTTRSRFGPGTVGRDRHAPAQAAAIRPASRTLPRTAARLALREAPSVCRTR